MHNATRKYFDRENAAAFPVCKAFNDAFQDKRTTGTIERIFGTKLGGTYLRVEYAQDIDGFWLEPHTDLGVKVFTMLLYLSKDPGHRTSAPTSTTPDKKPSARPRSIPTAPWCSSPPTSPTTASRRARFRACASR